MTTLHIVTACTNRKRGTVADRRIGDFLYLPMVERVEAWWERLRATAPEDAKSARDTYVGSHWQRSVGAADEAAASGTFDRVQLYVMSAGYGLIPADEAIGPYAATFAPSSVDCVLREGDRSEAWWDLLSQYRLASSSPRSLHELASQSPDAAMVIVGSTQYLGAVAHDVRRAATELPSENVTVICGGSVPRSVRRFSLDLDGTKAVGLDARMIDLAASALLHLAETVGAHAFQRSAANDVLSAVPSAPPPSANRKARSVSDSEVRAFIDRACTEAEGVGASKTALLKRLRNDSDLACEYRRFGRLYDEVVAGK